MHPILFQLGPLTIRTYGVMVALADHCKVESPARMEGKRMVALLAPRPNLVKEKPKEKSSAPPKPKPVHPEALKAAAAKAAAAEKAATEKPATGPEPAVATPATSTAPASVGTPAPAS